MVRTLFFLIERLLGADHFKVYKDKIQMKRIINIFFVVIYILFDVNIAKAFVPRQKSEPVHNKTEVSNILSNEYRGMFMDKATNPNIGPFLYTNVDFNALPIETIDEITHSIPVGNELSTTLQNYYRPKKVSALIDQVERLNLKELRELKSNNLQLAPIIEEVLSYSVDSISSQILFEEYLFLRENGLLSSEPIKEDEYQLGKEEYLMAMKISVDQYLDYESKLFNAVLYLESIKAFERLNATFREIVNVYSEYEAPNSSDNMKTGFEKLINSYDSKQNIAIVREKMEDFLNQCNINRQNILRSYFIDNVPNAPKFSLTDNSFRKFKYVASPSDFNEFYNYKISKEKRNTTAGVISSVVGLFTGFIGGLVVDTASGAYKSSNISDIANKDYETRRMYIIDAYNQCLDDLSVQINKLEKNLRTQYNQNKKSFSNDLSKKY